MTDPVQLLPDRCVIEVTGRPFLRKRFRAVSGTLTTKGERSLTLVADAGSLKTAIPWLGPAARGPRQPTDNATILFETQRTHDWKFTGRLTVHSAWYDLTLRARVVHADDETVVLAAKGQVGRVRVELAAEFGR